MNSASIELRAAAIRREQLTAQLRALRLQGALIYSRRRSAVTWLSGYAPGFISNSAALWIPAGGEPTLGVAFPFEIDRAHRTGLRTQVMKSPVGLVPQSVRRLGILSRDLAVDETTPALLEGLAQRGIDHVDLASWANEAREIKTREEVQALTEAARIADLALRAAAPIHVGETDYAVAARVEAAARAAGALRCLCLVGFGDGSFVTEATGKRLEPHEAAGLEVSLYAHGAFMHVNTTVAGAPTRPVDSRAIAVCREARAVLIAAMRPGAPVDAVVAAGDGVLQRHQLLPHKEYDFGHGLGCDTPEYPQLITGTGRTVRPGAVVAVHVMLRRSGGETAMVGGPVLIGTSGAAELLPDAIWAQQ
jgi:Xaa-Pro aminopeptidase